MWNKINLEPFYDLPISLFANLDMILTHQEELAVTGSKYREFVICMFYATATSVVSKEHNRAPLSD